MCLAAWTVAQSARFPWVIATNRDEYFDRAAAPLAWWRPQPDAAPILGGRDLAAGGTWLGLSAAGGFALVTNVRGPQAADPTQPSRGELVTASLAIDAHDKTALAALARVPRNGFNLLRADLRSAGGVWFGNRPFDQRRFGSGVHGLSNAALDTPWPKVTQLKQRLAATVAEADSQDALIAAAFRRAGRPDAGARRRAAFDRLAAGARKATLAGLHPGRRRGRAGFVRHTVLDRGGGTGHTRWPADASGRRAALRPRRCG